MQRRYSWTDEYILQLPYMRLKQLMIDSAQWEADENRESFRQHAFVAWHHSNSINGLFGGGKTEPPTFIEFLDAMGLGEGTTEEPDFETAAEVVEYIDSLFGHQLEG
ncbi:hypothetical protein P4T04_05155 [Bacillus badius]|uniref:hypothetical protein n=1 Tax=Bacillus badius TaxID=1455 RepID=UPI002E1E4E09|nr:hypothetical protein [Bacillus badius]